jgi:hypothetical protein
VRPQREQYGETSLVVGDDPPKVDIVYESLRDVS